MSQLFNDCLSKRALLDFIAKGPYLNVIAKKLYWLSKQDTYISNMFKRHWNLLCGFRPFFPKRTYLIKPKNIQRWAIMVPHSNKNELYAKTYLLQRSRNIPYHTYPSASWYMNILGCTYLHVPHIPIVYLLIVCVPHHIPTLLHTIHPTPTLPYPITSPHYSTPFTQLPPNPTISHPHTTPHHFVYMLEKQTTFSMFSMEQMTFANNSSNSSKCSLSSLRVCAIKRKPNCVSRWSILHVMLVMLSSWVEVLLWALMFSDRKLWSEVKVIMCASFPLCG